MSQAGNFAMNLTRHPDTAMAEPAAFPKERQPDAVADHVQVAAPSLWVYVILTVLSIALIAVAFWFKVDWPGLFVSLGSSLIAAVVLLVFVDRKLRETEIQQIRRIPKTLGVRTLLAVSPRHRQLHLYTRAFLAALDIPLMSKVSPADLQELIRKGETGFVLLGGRGSGKTTRLQMLAAHWANEFLETPTKKAPVLFPLHRWLPDRSLENAIFEHINSFAPVWNRSFRRTLLEGKAIVILDGADEIFMLSRPSFSSEFPILRASYPAVTWIVSSRPDLPTPVEDLPQLDLSSLTQAEMQEVARRAA
jgi:hypothetical protein